jgi:LPS sulfotransferase NodH
VEPVRSYVICCVQRTGSWLLAHTLADTGYAGRPFDYFDEAERGNRTREWGLPDGHLTAYVRAMWNAATTPNGVLGLPPVRYRQQADRLTEHYVALVRSAVSSSG